MRLKTVYLVPVALVVVLLVGLGVGLKLVSQPQKTTTQAARPGGAASFRLEPSTANVAVGDNLTLTGKLNTGQANVLSYQIVAYFTYATANPPLEFTSTTVTPVLSDFTCQFNQITLDSGAKKYTFAVSCNTPASTPPTTYTTNGSEVSVFTVNLHAAEEGSLNYVYDENLSKVNDSDPNATDILAIPQGSSYIVGQVSNPTPTPT